MKLLLTTLCVLFSTIVLSQQQSSFLITNTADTLYGNIERTGDTISITNNLQQLTFPLSDIKIFKNSKKPHTVWSGTLYPFNDNLDRNLRFNIDSYDTALVLTTIYQSPKMDLLEGHDKTRRTYFFVQRPSDSMPVQMMVSYHYQAQYNGSVGINMAKVQQVQVKTYITQLKMLTEGCKIPEKEWDFMDYRSYSFKRIIRLYNKCD